MTSVERPERPLSAIARTIYDNLRAIYADKPKKPAFIGHALPYLQATLTLNTCDDHYGLEYGDMIVAYLLSNLVGWRGPMARSCKHELQQHLDYFNARRNK